ESSLDPQTVSRSGAVGLWQFMYATAKGYDFTMDGSMDERRDTYSTTYAVCDYLQQAHDEFDDWLLALASYNCGRGGVRRAIKRSGLTNPTYWELAPFLPQETRNYIPKFIAMSYVLNHAEIYGLVPAPSTLNEEHKVMMLDKAVSLETIANSLSVSTDLLKELNPAYKKTIVNASVENPRRLIIPYHEQHSDSLIYAALNNQSELFEKETRITQEAPETVVEQPKQKRIAQAKSNTYSTYTVRRGDTLSGIASKHRGTTVTKLKADNKLKGSHLKIGQKLKVYKGKG
ncbi:MAG: transglycosylase SLT domain-containing protein, partial [Sphingobacterium sp.]